MSLKDHLQNLTRHSLVYTVSTFIQRTLGLIMMPVYTSTAYMASRSEYADLTLFYVFTAFMNIVYLYGMDSAFMRYYFLGKFSRKDIYKTAFLGVSLNAVIISLVIFAGSGFISSIIFGSADYGFHIKLAALILFLDTFSNLPYLILRVEEKSVSFSTIKIARFLLELIFNIVFVVYYKMGLIGILYANALAAFVNLVILLPYQFTYFKGKWDFTVFKELALFAVPMLPNGIAYLIVEVSDKFLMRILLDKDTLGIYSANYKFGTILLMLVIAFRTAWQPFFLKIAVREEAKNVYARVLTYFVLVGVIIIVLVTFFIEYIVRIPLPGSITILGQNYWSGISVIPVILTSYLFFGMYVNFTVGIYIKKKTYLMVVFTGLAAIVNIVSNLYLMPAFGIMGAAIATLISYMVMAVSIFIANQAIYPVLYEYKRIFLLLCYLAIMLAVYYISPPDLLIRVVIVLLTPVLFMLAGFFNRAEILTFKALIRKIT